MRPPTSQVTGCGSTQCSCSGEPPSSAEVARINGVALHLPGRRPPLTTLRERAWTELLRQRAVALGLFADERRDVAPELGSADRAILESMLEQEVSAPQPTDAECERHYRQNPHRYMQGQSVHIRHILFAVTPGVDTHALAVRADQALLELSRRDVPAGRFAQLAAELSNCPSGARGGDLGWVGPDDCAPELANELFHQRDPQWGLGLHPRLMHTRFGLHIVDVLGRRKGVVRPFEAVREAIGAELAAQAKAIALHHYMCVLAGQARIQGVQLPAADSPLLQ